MNGWKSLFGRKELSKNSILLENITVMKVLGELKPANKSLRAPLQVTRKVFLCSACGTYYENWNLFLHMREVHRRFICLYCLGMFSQSAKLSQHLVAKHGCLPTQFASEQHFMQLYKEPCFLMCCECETIFDEQNLFFSHACQKGASSKAAAGAGQKSAKVAKAKHKEFVQHVTGDFCPDDLETAATGEDVSNEAPSEDEPRPKGGDRTESPEELQNRIDEDYKEENFEDPAENDRGFSPTENSESDVRQEGMYLSTDYLYTCIVKYQVSTYSHYFRKKFLLNLYWFYSPD